MTPLSYCPTKSKKKKEKQKEKQILLSYQVVIETLYILRYLLHEKFFGLQLLPLIELRYTFIRPSVVRVHFQVVQLQHLQALTVEPLARDVDLHRRLASCKIRLSIPKQNTKKNVKPVRSSSERESETHRSHLWNSRRGSGG